MQRWQNLYLIIVQEKSKALKARDHPIYQLFAGSFKEKAQEGNMKIGSLR